MHYKSNNYSKLLGNKKDVKSLIDVNNIISRLSDEILKMTT